MQLTITDDKTLNRALQAVSTLDPAKGYTLEIKPLEPRRGLPMNALWWVWMDELAKHVTKKTGEHYTKDDLHQRCKIDFLGWEPSKRIGSVEVPPQIRSSAKLTKGEFLQLMEQVKVWAVQLGLELEAPVDSEFWRLHLKNIGVEQ